MTDAGESVNKDAKEPCPQVFVVDSQAFPRQVPIRLDVPRLTLVYLLLAVALLGVFIEAGFICHLYSKQVISPDIQKVEYIKGEKDSVPSEHDFNEIVPGKKPKAESIPAAKADDKPAAFLQSSSTESASNGVLLWKSEGYPMFQKGLDYKNNSLYVQQDGYYYIFSKISHLDNCEFFKHTVMQRSDIYNNEPILLMQNSRYSCSSNKPQGMGKWGNSYLGGVFHLNKGDSVFVTVNNSSLVQSNGFENFFGAFMI
ncbi:tumor necrosis factor ligand superfamily member 14 isoform X1 [Megalobrama amblycephala]|uniref:tumor necrosis factor ligand superfamily member 14 isoform X1 n=1 Tax=Megalobrama amblycephala TaxID=75352 RepID=UPI0020144A65|nr:tumor necrosis factor ligand superfamily member 14 isoform X1 [Megalobrama amblycephala]